MLVASVISALLCLSLKRAWGQELSKRATCRAHALRNADTQSPKNKRTHHKGPEEETLCCSFSCSCSCSCSSSSCSPPTPLSFLCPSLFSSALLSVGSFSANPLHTTPRKEAQGHANSHPLRTDHDGCFATKGWGTGGKDGSYSKSSAPLRTKPFAGKVAPRLHHAALSGFKVQPLSAFCKRSCFRPFRAFAAATLLSFLPSFLILALLPLAAAAAAPVLVVLVLFFLLFFFSFLSFLRGCCWGRQQRCLAPVAWSCPWRRWQFLFLSSFCALARAAGARRAWSSEDPCVRAMPPCR